MSRLPQSSWRSEHTASSGRGKNFNMGSRSRDTNSRSMYKQLQRLETSWRAGGRAKPALSSLLRTTLYMEGATNCEAHRHAPEHGEPRTSRMSELNFT